MAAALPEATWLQPIPANLVLPAATDPADAVVARETIRLAFVAALQYLPPRQRAVLILRDVLRWQTTEVADLLETTVVAAKGLLRRARANLSERNANIEQSRLSAVQRELLSKYVDAFERYDIDELVALRRYDATLTMPPHPTWLRGVEDIRTWWVTQRSACEGFHLVPVAANGSPVFAQYRPDTSGGMLTAFAITVVTCTDQAVTALDLFVDPELFALFGLPDRIDPRGR